MTDTTTPAYRTLVGDAAVTAQLRAERDAALALTALQARAEAAQKWQPIETAPKNGAEILIYGAKQDGAYLASYQYGDWWVAGPWDEGWTELTSPPTHWMPLPEPPADLAEGGEG